MKVKFLADTHFRGVDYKAAQVVEFDDLTAVRDLVLANRIEVLKEPESRETAIRNPPRETRGKIGTE